MTYFHLQFDALQHLTSFEDLNIEGGYTILPAVHKSWKTSKRRMLFVLESMDSIDIQAGRLFSSRKEKNNEQNAMIATIRNCLEQSWHLYQEYLGKNSLMDTPADPNCSLAFANFNATKYFSLRGVQRKNAVSQCTARAIAIIERLKPTDVVICGDTAATELLQSSVDNPHLTPYRRGWVFDTKIGKQSCKVTHTLDIESLYNERSSGTDDDEDSDDTGDDTSKLADLLYLVCRNWNNAFAGKHLHDLSHIKPKPILVDTIEKFDKLFTRLWEFDGPIGFDIESKNLESYHNAFYTQQYAFDETKAYLLILRHPLSKFSNEDCDYMEGKLRKLWASRKNIKEFVGVNLQFDLRVVRAQLDIQVIYHKIWDCPAAESLLDENLSIFDKAKFRYYEDNVKTTFFNLRNLFTHYGNDSYWTMKFSKEDRGNLGSVDIYTHKDAQEYTCLDAQSCIGMRRMQLERASKIRLSKTQTYEEVYKRHILNQMSDTVMAVSHMYQDGSHVDMEYMAFLTSKASPLVKVMKEVQDELREMPNVKEANKILLKAGNVQQTNLFGGSTSLFEINKGESLPILFFDVMGLKIINTTETGKPSIDKAFLKEHGMLHREVELVEQWRKAGKLMSTYVKGWSKKIKEKIDSAIDHCLRPSFGFFLVTGRLNSFNPNLQQVPNRGPSAKYIKAMFTPRKGRIQVKWDFSAAEVKFAAILGRDEKLKAVFRVGQTLRKQWIVKPSDELKAKLKKEGDVHILNIKRLFGYWVEKSHPLREGVKQIIFGAIYGKSVQTLAKDLEGEARSRHTQIEIDIQKRIKAVEAQLRNM